MLNCDRTLAWEDFSIIGGGSNYYLLETKENLFIKQENPSLKGTNTLRSSFYSSHLRRIIFY